MGSKTTADGDCSQEINREKKKLGRKAMPNLDSSGLDSILKSRVII